MDTMYADTCQTGKNPVILIMQAGAQRLVGRGISLASPSQLSAALYTDLGLPPPPDRAGR